MFLGNYRCNSVGLDLNRLWHASIPGTAPTIHAMRLAAQKYTRHPLLSLDMIIDMHAHSTCMNGFIFANMPADPKDMDKVSAFPKTLGTYAKDFSHAACKFDTDPSKAGTGRRALSELLPGVHCYTLEVSMFCAAQGAVRGEAYVPSSYTEMGQAIGLALHEHYCNGGRAATHGPPFTTGSGVAATNGSGGAASSVAGDVRTMSTANATATRSPAASCTLGGRSGGCGGAVRTMGSGGGLAGHVARGSSSMGGFGPNGGGSSSGGGTCGTTASSVSTPRAQQSTGHHGGGGGGLGGPLAHRALSAPGSRDGSSHSSPHQLNAAARMAGTGSGGGGAAGATKRGAGGGGAAQWSRRTFAGPRGGSGGGGLLGTDGSVPHPSLLPAPGSDVLARRRSA